MNNNYKLSFIQVQIKIHETQEYFVVVFVAMEIDFRYLNYIHIFIILDLRIY